MTKPKKQPKVSKPLKIKTYRVKYYFDGNGEDLVKARTKKEAEKKWANGEIETTDDWGENYNIDEINLAN